MADVELNLNGNIINQFKALAKEASEAQKSIERLKKQMESMTAKGSPAFNSKTSQILSSTNFSSIQDLFAEIKSNKLMGAPGGTQTAQAAKQLTNLRNILKSVGNKELQEDIGGVTGRIDNVVRAMSGKAPGKNPLSQVMIPDAQLKGHEEEIKKSILGISDYIIKLEKSLTGINSVAQKEYKKANPSKTAAGTKIRGKDFSYDYDRYQSDPKYAKQVDELKLYYKRKADNYGDIGRSALQNAALKGTKVFGGTNGNYNGFWSELAQGFKNGINEGLKDFDIGELLSNTIKKGGKSRRQNKVLDKFGYDSEFILDTQAAMKTKSFQQFAKQQREKFGDLGKQMTDRDIMRGATKSDRANLLKQIKRNKEIDFSQLTKGDKSKVFAGLVNNKGATSMMGGLKLGGVFLTAAAGVGKLAEVAGKLGTEALKAYEGVQQLQTQLGVVFGSTVQSDKMFSQIEGYAKKSPFGVENMTQQAILLKQSGVYASELMDTMKRIGDISSGNNEKMKSISEVYARVMSSQRVTARDMRQLSTAGVPSYSALADAMGVERGLVRGKLQRGEVSAVDFQKMIERLTDKGGMFYGATSKGAETFAARKQNLADSKQMAMSSLGDLLTRLGSSTGQSRDGWYAGVLGWLEGIYNGIEEVAANTAKEKDVEAPDKILEEIKKREDILRDPTNSADVNAGTIGGQIKLMNEIEDLKKQLPAAYAKAFSSGSDLYEREKRKGGSVYNLFQQGTGANFEVRDKWGQIDEEATKKKIKEQYEYYKRQSDYHYFAKADVGTPGYFTDLYENYAKHSGVTRLDQNKVSKLQAAGFGDESAGLGLEDIIKSFEESIHPAKYAVEYYFSSLIQATQEGADDLNHQIENVKDTFTKSGEVNFGKTGLEGYGAQHLMTAARDDYQNNSPVYQMSWKDQKAYWDEQAKKEIELYSSKTKKGKDENGNDIYDMSGLTAEEMQRARELLMTSHEDISLLAHPENAMADGELTDQAMEEVEILRKNIEELGKVAENSGGEEVFGPFMNNLEELKKLLGPDFGKDAKNNLQDLSRMFSEGLVGSLNTQLENANIPPEVKAKLQAMKNNTLAATQTKTYNDDTSYINRRKQASLRAHVLSNVTGVSAERVANSKESSVMNAYLNNFSQRQTFAQLGKVLMQNGAELKDVARSMQEGKNGQKYGMYDWNKSTSSIEEQAAQKNVATQEALISAYQQQIDALQELTVGSIATRDQWDNLGSLSAQLGVAFELSAKTLADGTVQFTDATIQSAHKMMEELDFKKFNQQMTTIINKIEDQQHKEEGEAKIGSAVLEGKVSTSYVSSKNYGIIKQGLAQQVDVIKNEKDSTLKAGLNKSSFAGKEEAEEYVRTVNKKMHELGLDEIKVNVNTEKTTKGVATQSLVKEIDNLANKKLKDEYKTTHPNDKNMGGFYNWAKEEQYYKGWGNKSRYEMAYKDAVVEKGLGGSLFNTGYSGGEFYLNRLQGKNVKDLPKQSGTGETKTTYSVQLRPEDVDKIVNSVKEDLTSGNVTDADVELVASLGGVRDKMGVLIDSIDKNTAAQDHENSLKEMEDIRGKMLDYLGSHGLLGGTEEERERNKALRNDKAFADMDISNPLINKINTPHQDRLLELAGLSRNVDYDEFRKRRVNKIVNFGTDDKGKEKYLGLKDDAAVEEMRHYLTDTSSSKYVKKLKKAWNKDTGNEGVEKLKGQLKESGFDPFAKDALGEMDTSQLQTMLELFDQMGISVRELAAGGQEWDETLMDAGLQLEELSQNIKSTAIDGMLKGINTGFSKAGDLAYKLQNNLIEGADATMEMKKALAGVGAEMLNNIGAAMTETGLKIAGGAAAQAGGPNWSLVAAGLALAAAGGAASFGGGMLSAFASDNNKGNSDEAEDQLARLEDLKDNLAELLKQAKDDAIYYETNMRNKQALVFNDALSSTSVNDAIITPSGVVNTAPDDYIMAMKDPTQLMGKGGGGTNVSFSIVNESGTPMTVTRSETREGSGGTEIVAFVNAIVQKSMNDGEYDDVMAGMQVRQRGSQISS